MQSSSRLALQLEAHNDELNDYEDEESEYEDYYSDGDYDEEERLAEEQEYGNGSDEEGSLQLENDLARAAFGDLGKGLSVSGTVGNKNKRAPHELSLEEEKLLDMLQRRLVQKSSGGSKASSGKQQPVSVRSPTSSPALSSGNDSGARGGGPQREPKLQHTQDHQQLIYSLGPTPDPSISPEKIGKMVHRFRLQEEKRTRKLRAKREEAESTEVRRRAWVQLT